ncbi:hypothetical protein HYALB_00006646 [Hymenoscyphus albidus]|uniref:Chorismate synthase protein n=1 Tax=Hymenoscyphus albidus TaxID=595503 RepID=A0A9N9M4B5_9HELO|nr:hypothetical protein HYALB_00006646 [Hymenoscyphus albidus]
MGISWGTVKSLLLFFGPILLPKVIAFYRSLRSQNTHGIPIRPIPAPVSRALFLLFIASSLFLTRSLPPFAPDNIFAITQSRLQIPTDVLFTRLTTVRENGLTETDSLLRNKINSLESRLLYFQFGPDVLANCQFCQPEDANPYLYYHLPSLLAPHLINLFILALCTSGLWSGKEGAVWRKSVTILGVVLALIDIYTVSTYNHQENSRATTLSAIEPFFWKVRTYRFISLAILDGMTGWMLYLSSTNRAFVVPPSPAARVEATTRMLDSVRSKMSAMSILRNTINRDEGLREKSREYWVTEGTLMGQLMEEREVIESVNHALESRINMSTISKDAEDYAQNVLGSLQEAQEGLS